MPTNLSVEKVENLLTFCGLEVESIETVGRIKGGLKNYVVGQVLTCENHPDSDHLHLTTVDVGEEGVFTVIPPLSVISTQVPVSPLPGVLPVRVPTLVPGQEVNPPLAVAVVIEST